ncbi:MAG: cell division protein FtsA, partial [Pseudomonadota bacterium]
VELAEEVFHLPVRLGVPQHVTGLSDVVRNPIHATGVGLLLYGQKSLEQGDPLNRDKRRGPGVLEQMKKWFQGHF